MFRVAPSLDLKKLEAVFRHKVFKMLLAKGRITRDLIDMLSNWRHSGFQVFCGNRLGPEEETGMENLARYILRASFSQKRMQYLAEPSKVVYRAKDGTEEKVFDALEWLVPRFAGSPGENGRKPKRTGSPASWKPIKVRRNTGKTGPG